MLKHYSHIRMEAKPRALEAIVERKTDAKPGAEKAAVPSEVPTMEPAVVRNSGPVPTKSPHWTE
jgi:hypothetical protein